MIDNIIFMIIVLILVCICVGCFFSDCCIDLCDNDTIKNESDITISKIHEETNHVEL
uniref:Uncharacterized protein n=1 Tax=viral metagenome TaxID=1070528 RepID=A0A6C0EIY8_9ZZZZ